jgi:hypothetical protein
MFQVGKQKLNRHRQLHGGEQFGSDRHQKFLCGVSLFDSRVKRLEKERLFNIFFQW